ncbi:MAG: cold shock domain-containing protein [Pseudomonadota bacterium]
MSKESTLEFIEDGDILVGKVKWFDNSKGFGFVLSDGYDEEFLLHRYVLQRIRMDTLAEGAKITFIAFSSSKGLRVKEVLSVEKDDQLEASGEYDDQVVVSNCCIPARVKWFDAQKGYGFVNCFGSLEDVFVGASAMRSAGFTELQPGQALSINTAQDAKGTWVHQIHDWSTEPQCSPVS